MRKLKDKKKIIEIVKLWAEVEDIKVINFEMGDYDSGGVYCRNMYKVFSDERNYTTHIVFTTPDFLIKEGKYTIADLDLLFGGEQ